jgi:GTP-dependent phosphoenolpyruvate carboxykinase
MDTQDIGREIAINDYDAQLKKFKSLQHIGSWVEKWVLLTKPTDVVLVDGSESQHQSFIDKMISEGRMIKLNPNIYDNCYLV